MPKQRGRQPGFRMSDAHRVKIQNSNILNALIEHVEGKREMSQSQVTAGLGLLKKCLPDLSSVELTGEGGGPVQMLFKTVYERADD
ncbi:MAG: hypothetical protein H6881_09765 [Rhodobiaceae bacterium]|nr:hypothetical protein [Rhodobiaceae bacterium]